MKKAVVIGSGFAGMSAACFLAKSGWKVTVIEKLDQPGGRGRAFSENGFFFDMGPSWYWMPDVFERFFSLFNKKVSDYYHLHRLDPSYSVYYENDVLSIPSEYQELKKLFESIEAGSGDQLDLFMQEAAYKYNVGINKLVHKPGQSVVEFLDADLIKGLFKLDVFTSMKSHVRRFFKNEKLVMLMEFPVLFLGALPEKIPALYSLMNYADVKLGTWYPMGGMHLIGKSMHALACSLGVEFHFDTPASGINVKNGKAHSVSAVKNGNPIDFEADVVVGGADYHFIESRLLQPEHRSYTESYWESRVMAPSSLLYYVGINKKLKGIQHHTLFFDVDFETHGKQIYQDPQWPTEPLFYMSAPSVTDASVAPDGHENLFFLIPVSAGLTGDTEEIREHFFQKIVSRLEARIGQTISDSIVFKRSFAVSDFEKDYNAFKGNAYGLANTLMQTSILKPSLKSKKIKNLFYTGQLTVPGPGVPPSLISGEVVAKEINKQFNR